MAKDLQQMDGIASELNDAASAGQQQQFAPSNSMQQTDAAVEIPSSAEETIRTQPATRQRTREEILYADPNKPPCKDSDLPNACMYYGS